MIELDVQAWSSFAIAAGTVVLAIVTGVLCIEVHLTRVAERQHRQDEARRRERDAKMDVLRRIVGYRYRLTDQHDFVDGEPFIALNEAGLMFASDTAVMNALRALGKDADTSEALTRVVRAIARTIPANLDDEYFHDFPRPLTPG